MKMLTSQISIIDVTYVPGPNLNDGRFDLAIESADCPFFLGGSVSIPEDPDIYAEVDIPAYDGRSMKDWILETKMTWLASKN